MVLPLPPTPKNTLKTQNRAFLENYLLSVAEHQQILAFLQEFNQRIEQIAKEILQKELKALQTKAHLGHL